ncbi:MarR family 2-MHQ and catechol resistance regulon transcriptional repressor [Sporolactobacillus spathodeae]|uniref:MarR family 2-MHQ and catechol resistance regulon transcriptional repressor n=2 Tax=Sporolactobacillus spathodeae TaxID=1465502 RepID=A0ABS2Q7G1_9BACL|nr:MarR family 2-MHQ and catechol resistance regulon transcriptional repressor [Sporolactobacillus spathodeae]
MIISTSRYMKIGDFMNSGLNNSLKLFVVLSRAMQEITRQVEKEIKTYGLNPTEFAVLELLDHKGAQPIQKIGEKILLASSSITYVVDKLEKKNYLRRRPCSDDRRVTYAEITDEGKQFIDRVFPKHSEAIHELLGGLNDEEKVTMIQQLKKLGFYAKEH